MISVVLIFLMYFSFVKDFEKGGLLKIGYNYEPWHYYYVGVGITNYIHENDITFDVYYAYFIEK